MQVELHPAINSMRGKSGRWVFKKVGGTSYAANTPTPSTKPPTDGQQRVRDEFTLAADYAKGVAADPQARAIYEPVAEAQGKGVYRVAMNDALNKPKVMDIDLGEYTRTTGDKIYVRATDDFEVMSVQVTIKNGQGYETGAAVKSTDGLGRWVYTATTTIPQGASLTIEATATDRPGNKGTKSVAIN